MNRIILPPKLPDRPDDGHKGLFGRVLIIGGSDSMIGAPVLAGTAALKMGAGLVQVAMPRSVLALALSITPELIGLPLGDRQGATALRAGIDTADALVLGPGIGTSSAAKSLVLRLMQAGKPMVVDADALNVLAMQKIWPRTFNASAVLTPHPGEMKRLSKFFKRNEVPTDHEGRIEIALLAAKTFGQVVVLKGDHTVVTDGDRVYVNRTGDSSLSKAGTGDVLSGMIGTLLAQAMDRFDAASAATWIHGKAGTIAGSKLGRRAVLARDVVDALPEAIRLYENEF